MLLSREVHAFSPLRIPRMVSSGERREEHSVEDVAPWSHGVDMSKGSNSHGYPSSLPLPHPFVSCYVRPSLSVPVPLREAGPSFMSYEERNRTPGVAFGDKFVVVVQFSLTKEGPNKVHVYVCTVTAGHFVAIAIVDIVWILR